MKNKKIIDSLEELHKIREQNYNETKGMNSSEYIQHIRKKASKVSKHLKTLKIISSLDELYFDNRKTRKIS